MRHLKKGRVVVSLLLVLLISLLFLDVNGSVGTSLSTALTSLQFVPALLRILAAFGLPSIGFVAVVLLTLFCGRVYCSSLCPLGTAQDLVIALSRTVRGPRTFRYAPPSALIHYSLLAGAAILFVGGSVMLVSLLDPFSNFGRIVTNVFRPMVIGVNNLGAWVLGMFGLYTLAPMPFSFAGVGVLAFTLGVLGVVVYFSFYHGRLFCNSVCPVGALLGLISRVSAFKLVFDEEACKDCGLCQKICKAGCIDADRKVLDFSRCVSCYNCIDDCPTTGITYEFAYRTKKTGTRAEPDSGRRAIFAKSFQCVIGTLVAVGGTGDSVKSQTNGGYNAKPPVTPPGSKGTEHYTRTCTACYLCVSACPTQVIVPTFLEYGISGILQPKLDYSRSYCKYECTVCADVCPSAAIMPLTVDQKKETQVGRALFVKDDCIVITKKTECGACSEHCPTKAVAMVKREGLFLPEVNDETCVGCGACEHACPTTPRKAIYVAANPVHGKARKPETTPAGIRHDEPQEFPF